MKLSDKPIVGIVIGAVLPIICLAIFLPLVAYGKGYDSVADCVRHFQSFGVFYKIVSLSLMPNAGLFFWWTRQNRLSLARGVLAMCLLYGVAILAIYFV